MTLGEKGCIDVNELRKSLFNMFEMATLYDGFETCLDKEQMWEIVRFIQSLGTPFSGKEPPVKDIFTELQIISDTYCDAPMNKLINLLKTEGGIV